MKIFVTGGSGFVGSAVIAELLRGNHQVIALVRSAESAEKIEAAGAKAHSGDLEDLKSLQSGTEQSDGVIHCGFIHDFTKFKENCEIDRRAIEALGAALAGRNRPLVVTSGMGLNVSGRAATEDDMPPPSSESPRAASEEAARAAEKNRIPVAVVRLAPSVHGTGDHGFMRILHDIAAEKKVSAYVGDGSNRWCAVHRFDAAKLFRLTFEKLARGSDGAGKVSFYHGVAESEIAFRKIAEIVGKRFDLPAESLTLDEAAAHFTWFSRFVQIDMTGSSEKTRAELDWQPTEIGLLADIERPGYFGNQPA